MTLFSELGALKQAAPDADEVQKKIAALQKFITDNYYVCTDNIKIHCCYSFVLNFTGKGNQFPYVFVL